MMTLDLRRSRSPIGGEEPPSAPEPEAWVAGGLVAVAGVAVVLFTRGVVKIS